MNLRLVLFLVTLLLNSGLSAARTADLIGPFSQSFAASTTDTGWNFWSAFSTQATMTQAGAEAQCLVTQVDGTASDVKLAYLGAALANGQAYTLRFRAKASAPRLLQVVGENSKHDAIGLNKVLHLSAEWQTYQVSFTTQDVLDARSAAPQFWMGQNPGSVFLSDVSLTPGQSDPLPPASGPPSLPANVKSLVLRTFDKAAAVMMPDASAIHISIKTATGTPWHVQAALPDLPLQAGGTYTLTYRAKANMPRSMLVVAQATGDYRNIGLNQNESLTTQWQTFTRTFHTAEVEPKPDEIQFQLAKDGGSLWLADLRLSGPGLQAAAPAAPPELVPQAGELLLRGTITGVSRLQNRVFLSVTALQPFGGALTTLASPRPKTILVAPDIPLLAPDQSPVPLEAARPGLTISVVGQDSGVGKPLAARKMQFQTP